MSRIDIEMTNDLIAFAQNLRSRGFVTHLSSTTPNRHGHARERSDDGHFLDRYRVPADRKSAA
jgi:hypothetical protein